MEERVISFCTLEMKPQLGFAASVRGLDSIQSAVLQYMVQCICTRHLSILSLPILDHDRLRNCYSIIVEQMTAVNTASIPF